ncbi:MAG: CHASE2 domain-containing protein [Gallionellaceae bacterium]
MEKLFKGMSLPAGWNTHLVRFSLGMAVVGLFVLHGVHLFPLPLVDNLEGSLYDTRLRATMPNTLNRQVVIIDIDEKSLQEEGRWPWSRARLAQLVDKLFDRYNVAVMGVDVVFAESENQAGLKLLEPYTRQAGKQNREVQNLLSKFQGMLNGDTKFAHALQDRNVVLGYYFKNAENNEARNLSGKLPAQACDLGKALDAGFKPQIETGYGANLPLLQDAAAGGGHFIPNVDADGIIRSIPMLVEYQGKCYESLSLAIMRRIVGAKQVEVVRGHDPWSKLELKVGELGVPVSADASAWIPYRGYQGSFAYVSAADVLQGRADSKQLEGAVVLLGTTAAGLLDYRSTPVSSSYAGIEAHANMVAGMLDDSVMKSPTAIAGMESWMLLLLGVLAAVLLGRAAPMQVMWMSLLLGSLVVILNLALWISAAVVLPLASSLIMLATLFVFNMSYGFLDEERNKRKMKETFGQYVAPELIDELMANTQAMESMEGISRNMTVLFSDIRNFTTISEGMEPKQLMRMMNEYLTPMTRLIIDKDKYQGTIDKYIGDAIMAFWGAPLFDKHHAQHAVLAAMEMQKLAATLTAQFTAKGWPEIRIGVGLNTGAMAVGNMGSSFRRAYTVLGDPVNLAARLEGLTKEYGVGILVSETTKEAAVDIVYRELDRVRVKGKGQAVSIFEPVCTIPEVSEQQLEDIRQFEQMLAFYRAQQWNEAQAILQKLPAKDSVLVKLYTERIEEMRATPPSAEWDGVTTFKTK